MQSVPPFFVILKRFYEEEVKYIIIGGVAAVLYGVPRATFDLDIILDFSEQNVDKLIKVLNEFNLRPTVPISPIDFCSKEKRDDWTKNKNAKVINFIDPAGNYRLDVALIYDYNKTNRIVLEIENIRIYVVDKETLIKMKTEAGRDIDLRDIKNLIGI